MRLRILMPFLLAMGFIAGNIKGQSTVRGLPFVPSSEPRMVAEWEPANGVLIAWPPRIPHKLIKELSKDVVLYILVENHTIMRESIQWLSKWGIMPNQVEFVVAPH